MRAKKSLKKISNEIVSKAGDISKYLDGQIKIEIKEDVKIKKAMDKLDKLKKTLAFLSLFDFSVLQMDEVNKIIQNDELQNTISNPYIILEKYPKMQKENWLFDQSDLGIDLYNIDIALIPDTNFANWYFKDFDAESIYRIRAIISEILLDASLSRGDTCLTREEILEKIGDYPLYYIHEKLQIGAKLIKDYESSEAFKEKFEIKNDPETGETLYQLKSIREIEKTIENFIKEMLKKSYQISKEDEESIKLAAESDLSKARVKFDRPKLLEERERVYKKALENRLTVISGKAGTGKTQAITNLVKYFDKKGKRVFVLSPTGKSNMVIRERLPKNLKNVWVSTIHRFLYGYLPEFIKNFGFKKEHYPKINEINDLIGNILEGEIEFFLKLQQIVKKWRIPCDVLILDEASMVDEALLAVLFSTIEINEKKPEHLILVGDERQLPPIGIGRPFSDIIFFLKRENHEKNIALLETNLRFSPDTTLGAISETFAGDEELTSAEINNLMQKLDKTARIEVFSNREELENILKTIILEASGKSASNKNLFELFKELFENGKNIDRIQILAPRRVGEFGCWDINSRMVMNGRNEIIP
ncbi:MAG: AAA family ATPase [Archaeoglobaceae archaeon]